MIGPQPANQEALHAEPIERLLKPAGGGGCTEPIGRGQGWEGLQEATRGKPRQSECPPLSGVISL